MFPALTTHAVASVLQQYKGNMQTALDQLVMLNRLVSSQEEDAHDRGPDEDSSRVPELTEDENLDYLAAEFPAATPGELLAALDGSYGKLSDAMQLLHAFAIEDAVPSHKAMDAAALASRLDGPAMAPGADAAGAGMLALLSCLGACFPGVAEESLQVSLECAGFDMDEARSILRDQGCTEVDPTAVEADTQHAVPAAELAAEYYEVACDSAAEPSSSALSIDDITAGLPSCSAETLRNQIIYDQERGDVERLKIAYRQLIDQARLASGRGDSRLAGDLSRRANELRAEHRQKQERCAVRIRHRVNQGKGRKMAHAVDLHGMHVGEALDHMDSGLRQLPHLFPGGITVRYITGRGCHSADGAQVHPAVVHLLRERGASFEEHTGYVDVMIDGADAPP